MKYCNEYLFKVLKFYHKIWEKYYQYKHIIMSTIQDYKTLAVIWGSQNPYIPSFFQG